MDINQLIEEITREVMKELNNTADFGKSQSGYNAEYAKYIDHTVLRPETTKATVEKFCRKPRNTALHRYASTPPM